jgi:hypothetical protein
MCISIFQRTDQFGPVGSVDDLRDWLGKAGFAELKVDRRGAYATFAGVRAGEG